jgi:hypothetical protein
MGMRHASLARTDLFRRHAEHHSRGVTIHGAPASRKLASWRSRCIVACAFRQAFAGDIPRQISI